MDFRRDDEQKHANEEQFHEEAQTPQTAGSEEQQSEQPAKEPELILKKDTDDQSDLTNKETAEPWKMPGKRERQKKSGARLRG